MLTRQELASHIDSVCRSLGCYIGTDWHIFWDGEAWQIVGKRVGYRLRTVPNGDRDFYDELEVLVRDFVFLDLATRGLLDPEGVHRDFGEGFNEWDYQRA